MRSASLADPEPVCSRTNFAMPSFILATFLWLLVLGAIVSIDSFMVALLAPCFDLCGWGRS